MNRNTAPPDVPKWTPLGIICLAVGLALTTGAGESRLALEINPLSGVAYRSNLTVPTVITAGTFVGDLAGDITVITTNWMPNLTVTGAAALGPSMSGNGGGVTNIQTNNVAGLASFISAIAPSGGGGGGTNWYATLTVTGTANLGQISGDGSGITNIFSTPTNWASSMTITGLLDLGSLTLGYPGSWSFLTGNIYQFGRLYATNEQNLLGGQGVGLTNVPTSGVAGLHSLITNIASGPSNVTSHLTDIDTYVAPASAGTPTWYDPENGQSWDATEIRVYPMYSNALGVVYGDALSASHWGGNSYQAWAWPAQTGAFLYHVHAHTYYGVDETDVYGQTSATNIMVDALTGTNIASRPSTLASTNEIRSLYLMSLYGSGGSNAITSIAAPLTNSLVPWEATNAFLHAPATNPFITAPVATGIAQAVHVETNWWAVITIDDPASMTTNGFPMFTDITVKCWTNGPTHGDGSTPVFRYTTTDPLLNGTPAWETFTTNWYPRAFWCQVHASHDLTWLAEWKSIKPTYSGSIAAATAAWDGSSAASNPFRWVLMFRDTGAWFHPSNNLAWAYMMQNSTLTAKIKARDGSTLLNNEVWNKTTPMWVTYDPRPKKFRAFDNTSADMWVITNQHQQP